MKRSGIAVGVVAGSVFLGLVVMWGRASCDSKVAPAERRRPAATGPRDSAERSSASTEQPPQLIEHYRSGATAADAKRPGVPAAERPAPVGKPGESLAATETASTARGQ